MHLQISRLGPIVGPLINKYSVSLDWFSISNHLVFLAISISLNQWGCFSITHSDNSTSLNQWGCFSIIHSDEHTTSLSAKAPILHHFCNWLPKFIELCIAKVFTYFLLGLGQLAALCNSLQGPYAKIFTITGPHSLYCSMFSSTSWHLQLFPCIA